MNGTQVAPASILSVQSHVAYGYVGNRAAAFPLQRMGFDVIAVNTVQFSNHPGHGAFKGEVFSPGHIASLLEGIAAIDGFRGTKAVLSGYLGDAALGRLVLDEVARLKARDPAHIYVCDPVMGDSDRGFFVRPGIPEFFHDEALALATHLTPNQFELEALTGHAIKTLDDAKTASAMLHRRGVATILVTSLETEATPSGVVEMLVSDKAHGQYVSRQPKLPLDPMPNGAGDCVAALLCGAVLKGFAAPEALARVAAAIHAAFEATSRQGGRELALIAAQTAFELKERAEVSAV